METYKYDMKDIYGNPVPDSHITPVLQDKINATGDYDTDCKNNIGAHSSNGSRIALASFDKKEVRFVAGLWRIQDKDNDYRVTQVRDKQFVLGEKIGHREKNLFEYYRAALVCKNCYGITHLEYDYIVAKYDTDNGSMLSYGTSIEQARAFLGIALFDKHIDMIHKIERKKLNRQK